MAAVRMRGRGGRQVELEAPPTGRALVALLARALGLQRVALLAGDGPEAPLTLIAAHGRVTLRSVGPGEVPGDGPWSLAVPLSAAGRTGLLLLARAAGAPLLAADRELARRLAGDLTSFVAHPQLVAELAHARAQLAQADRLAALGTLAAGVAHEIRNPLVSVRTFIQLLPERLHDREFLTEFRDVALDEIGRVCGLINDLLAFSRPVPARVQREPTDLNDLLGQIARLLDPEARKEDVTVTCTTDPALPPVVANEGQVKQVLMNVVLNAIQACGPGGAVEVTTGVGARGCTVTVADSGPGIAPEHRHQLFEPFFTTKDAGSGLGLFIAQQIMSEHGGHITTEAHAGGGAVFCIEFPPPERTEHADA